MGRHIGFRKRVIRIVSDHPIESADLEVMEIDCDVPANTLIDQYEVRDGILVNKNERVEWSKLRVAFVGVYHERCGIATYSEALWPEIGKYVGEWRIFCEDGTASDDARIVPCWTRGQSLSGLVGQIKDFQPDVVMIQHEYGIFPDARHWLALMSNLRDFRVLVTMHSIYRHRDKTIVEAATPEIIVHTTLARDVLKNEKKVPGSVHVIPHGCFPCSSADKLWNLYRSSHTFMQFGFGFRYKSWEVPIRAVALLKDRYPDVFFTGLFSESPHSLVEHRIYADELHELINSLGVADHVALIRGYQSDETLQSYLRTNQVAVFPYVNSVGHEVFGCSGAARLAMSTGIPVIASRVPHFHDLEGVCPRITAPEELADTLGQLFQDRAAHAAQIKKQNAFLIENSWDAVAKQYLML